MIGNEIKTLFDLIQYGIENADIVHSEIDHSYATVVELNKDTLTEAGIQEWSDILGAKVECVFEGIYNTHIEVSGCSAKRVRDFTYMLAGYVSESNYRKWVNDNE